MRVVVDPNLCADHGQCVFAAPDVFRFDDDGKLAYEAGELDEGLRDAVTEAMDVCPVQAITITG